MTVVVEGKSNLEEFVHSLTDGRPPVPDHSDKKT